MVTVTMLRSSLRHASSDSLPNRNRGDHEGRNGIEPPQAEKGVSELDRDDLGPRGGVPLIRAVGDPG